MTDSHWERALYIVKLMIVKPRMIQLLASHLRQIASLYAARGQRTPGALTKGELRKQVRSDRLR
jgi:hypothetical protein